MRFQVCVAHLSFGRGRTAETAAEVTALGRHLHRRAPGRDLHGTILSANLNIGRPDSPVVSALRAAGVQLPDELLRPTLALSKRYAGAIAFVSPRDDLRLGPSDPNSGVFDFKRVLFAPGQLDHYRDGGLYAGRPDGFVRWGS